MSRSGKVTFIWGDGSHIFRLAVKELEELQEKTDAGPQELLRRIDLGTWRIADVREPHRIGLIGGGMKPAEAYKLIERYASEPPFAHLVISARAILTACLIGAPDGERPGKRRAAQVAADAPQSNSPTESSPSPPSTGPVLQ